MNVRRLVVVLALSMSATVFAQTTTGEKPEPKAPAPEDPARRNLDILSRLRIAGYVQGQYVHSDASSDTLTGTGASRNLDTFSVRRARINFQYQVLPTSRFVLQPDFSSSGVALRDAYVELTEPWTRWRNALTAGQFKLPFGHEIRQSSRDRELPERSLIIRTLFPGERDRGVMLSSAGLEGRFNYRIGIFNGNGIGQSADLDKRKDIAGRVGSKFGPVDIGVSGYYGSETIAITTNPLRQGEFDKERYGADVQWTTPVKGLSLRGEYITGTQPPSANQGVGARDADVDGWYLYLVQKVSARHQFALRADEYDPNRDTRDDATLTIGGSYIFHWDRNSRIMLAYEHPERQSSDPEDDLVTLRYQFSF